jgi:hypothetical protein
LGPEAKPSAPCGFFKKEKSGGCGIFSLFLDSGSRKSPAMAHVAQLAEHVLGKDEVIGSIPIMGSRPVKTFLAKKDNNKKQEIAWQKNRFKEQSRT